MFEDGIYVKHKTEGFIGLVDGQTSLKEFFTGNKEVASQYRIREVNSSQIRIAPEEDLEAIDYKPIKTAQPYDPAVKFKEQSFLREAGYHLQLNANKRREILTSVVEEYNLYKVVSFLLKSTMFNRTGNKLRVLRNMNSLKQWGSDVDWLIENFKEAENYPAVLKLFEETKFILDERGYRWKSEAQ